MTVNVKNMRFIVRLLGNWLLGLALILLIIDGTKSLAANALVFTTLSDTWMLVNMESLENFEQAVRQSLFGFSWDLVLQPVLSWAGWAVSGVPGLILAFMGRSQGNHIRKLPQI